MLWKLPQILQLTNTTAACHLPRTCSKEELKNKTTPLELLCFCQCRTIIIAETSEINPAPQTNAM